MLKKSNTERRQLILTETDRLIIRNFVIEDIETYAEIVSDPVVMKYIGTGKTQTYEEAQQYLLKCITSFSRKGWSRFAVVEKYRDELLGFCGFAEYNNELDFGWRYGRKYWGKGYGAEAAMAVLNLGLEQFRFPRIVCIAYPENAASIKIIKKVGMKYEKQIQLNNRTVHQYVKLN